MSDMLHNQNAKSKATTSVRGRKKNHPQNTPITQILNMKYDLFVVFCLKSA